MNIKTVDELIEFLLKLQKEGKGAYDTLSDETYCEVEIEVVDTTEQHKGYVTFGMWHNFIKRLVLVGGKDAHKR